MDCKFIWNNLPQKIKKEIIEPLKTILSEKDYKEIRNLSWYMLPQRLEKVYDILLTELENCTQETSTIKKDELLWNNLPYRIKVLCEIKDALIACSESPVIPTNLFDARGNWAGDFGITDEASFIAEAGSGLVVENFVVSEGGNRITCNIISGDITNFSNLYIFSLPDTLNIIIFDNVEFDPSFIFRDTVTVIELNGLIGQLTSALPPNLTALYIVGADDLTSLPTLPPSVTDLSIGAPSISQVEIDKIATEFLQGVLPKNAWTSFGTIEPSAPIKAQLEANVTTTSF